MTLLSAQLEENNSSKWPELNFNAFISTTIEVIRHIPSITKTAQDLLIIDCYLMIAQNLKDAVVLVNKYCVKPISLKELLTLCCKVTENSKAGICVAQKQLESSLYLLLLSNVLVDVVSAVFKEILRKDFDGTCNKIKMSKLIIRKTVLFLMKYGSILEDDGQYVHI